MSKNEDGKIKSRQSTNLGEILTKSASVPFFQLSQTIEETNKKNVERMQKAINPARMLAESIKPPSLFEEQIKNIERLTEPLRVDFKIPEAPIRNLPLRDEDMFKEDYFDVEDLSEPQESYQYHPETKSLIVSTYMTGAINFGTRSGESNMATLIEIFIEALKERGEIKNGYVSVFVPVTEILQKAREKGKEDADMNWLKKTRRNIISTKITEELKHSIKISEYDKNRKGYYFKIKN